MNGKKTIKKIVDTGLELRESKDRYEVTGNISEWLNKTKDKNDRYICFDLDKLLVIDGNVVVNGYINTNFPIKVKGIYKVGDKYENPK